MNIKFKKLYDNVEIPKYATDGSAGFDLIAHNFKSIYVTGNNPISINEDATIVKMYPNARLLVGLGFSVAIPKLHVMDIRPRSGNALKYGLTVLNSPGTIDSKLNLK